MTLTNPTLWKQINDYVLPIDSSGRTFDEQLIAEHRITRVTAEAAIGEYRRFLYLSAVSDRRTVPSKAVDAVWHLHLGHTRDYWDRFCDRIGKRLHHTPGTPKGHSGDYRATLDRYRAEFGGEPPHHFWGGQADAGTWLLIAIGGSMVCAPLIGDAFEKSTGLAVFAAGAVLLLIAVPGILRRIGVLQTPPLKDKPLLTVRNGNGGGCGGGADCGGGGCGGD